ncbi:MAG: histidine phosphatase family protein [Pseudomonadales bacterium]|nr:histidine phosphatase family protein [Pseudomonadales bacterium]
MRLLTLVRHGKSSWKYDGLEDFERPLNQRGWKDVPNMALRFVNKGHRPDYLLSSYATRALTTARLFAQQLKYPVERIRLSEQVYECFSDDLYDVIRGFNDQHWHACLFGHNPSFTVFVNDLCGIDLDNVPTSGVVHMKLSIEHWKQIESGCGELVDFDFPKNPS